MGNYLVIANQTLGGAELREEIRKRLEKEPSSFYVLVPGTRAHDYPAISTQTGGGGGPVPLLTRATGPGPATDAEATAHARGRLGQLLRDLTAMGAEADGALGPADPLKAVGDVLAARSFDELILSTLPQPLSRWLGMDLPHRLQRRFGLPVTTVVSKE
jgi:hypothetical protein